MNKFWKKRLPAFLLVMILLVGMMPAALAVEGETAWKTDADNHWHEQVDETGYVTKDDFGAHRFGDVVKTKDPTCFQKGEGYQVCSVCDYQKTVEIDATGKHVASDEWSYNTASHWHACTATEGCPEKLNEASHSFPSGVYEQNDTYHWQNCDICGGESAKEKHVDSNGDGICDVCHRGGMPVTNKVTVTFKNGSATYATQEINKGSKPTKPSNPTMTASNKTYTFKGWVSGSNSKAVYTGQSLVDVAATTVSANTTYSAVYTVKATSQNDTVNVDSDTSGTKIGTDLRSAINSKFSGVTGTSFTTVRFTSLSSSTYGKLYTSSSKGTSVSTSSSYSYSTVSSFYFVPTSKTSFSIAYTATDDSGNSVSGTITLNVDASTSGTTITYTVKAGNEVAFDKSDFQSAYREEYDTGTIKYVRFETSDTLSTSKGTVYYNYDGSGEKAFTNSNIDDYDFYYSSSGDGDYALASLSYVAPKGASARTVELSYTAYYSTSKYVEGTVKIKVTSSSSGSSGDTITYEVEPGESVAFKKSDFEDVYEDELSGTIRYVTFSTTDTLSTSNGTVYYNYDKSGEKAFTKSNIDDYQFYYTSSSYGDYALANLSFAAPKDADERTVELDFRVYDDDDDYVSGTLVIEVGEGSGSSGDTITYEVEPGESVAFKKSNFEDVYEEELDGTIRYVKFTTSDTLSTVNGTVYYNYDESGEKAFSKTTIDDYKFYYTSSSYGDYALANLSFVAPKDADERTVELEFRVYDSDGDYVSGTLKIKVGDGSSGKGDITYEVAAGDEVAFDRTDFNDYYQDEKNSGNTIKWVTFSTSSTLNTTSGTVYFDYDGDEEKAFSKTTIDDYKFYYSSASYGDYALADLSFVAGKSFTTAVELEFKAYYSTSSYAEGTLVINPKGTTVITTGFQGDIVYYTTYNSTVQIKSSDIERFFHSKYPTGKLQSVVLSGVPATGGLYYNYFGVSKYGASKLKLTAANCKQYTLYASPSATSQYALTELLYVPSGSNYCTSIPFTAYGTGSQTVSGTILIGVTTATIGEVYGVTPKNTAVSFPASAIFNAVANASGTNLSSIQLLKLPASNVGTVYVGSGTSTKATTTARYGYSSGSQLISQLRFVPASGYTGSVEIPYVAYNSSGAAVAAGKFCLGVVNSVKKFSDVTSSTWCYKYVAELADSKVIDGYADGSFKPDNTITYGAALKLIMLAAGYPEQKPTVSGSPFSGYLAKARADGIITRTNVDLTKSITRLQVAQLAAGALKLDTTNLSTVQPFTDTTDASVRALNAAGIVEGYFSGGTSTYKPGNTLTRGQVSAIVWRMQNYRK